MRVMRFLCLFLAIALLGCSEFDGPETGTWRYSAVTPVQNDCNWNVASNPPGDFRIDNKGDTFHVTPDDGTPEFDCTLDGYEYSCPNRVAGEYSEGGSTLTWSVTAKGRFVDEKNGSGSQTGNIACAGAACAVAAQLLNTTFPCRLDVDYVISYRGD